MVEGGTVVLGGEEAVVVVTTMGGRLVAVVGFVVGRGLVAVSHPATARAARTTMVTRRRGITAAKLTDPGRCTVVLVMDLMRFTEEYELAAPVYGLPAAELRVRDGPHGAPARWLAFDGEAAVAAVTASTRPDDRIFLQGVGDPAGIALLGRRASHDLGRPVHIVVHESTTELLGHLDAAGFEPELTSEGFRIRFDDALRLLRRAWIPRGVGFCSSESGPTLRSGAVTAERGAFAWS